VAITIIMAVLIIAGFLGGIRLMQSPKTALWGNRLGSLAMLIAIFWTFRATGQGSFTTALIFILIGAIIGIALGQSVKMIHMPQTVALLNGFGGAASALVAWAAVLSYSGGGAEVMFWITGGLAVGIGAMTFSGSIIAVLKLQGLAFRRPVQLKGHGHILRVAIMLSLLMVIINTVLLGSHYIMLTLLIVLLALLAGLMMTLRIGGADMPIVISLLNSFSGIAAAIAGLAVENLILVGTGALVGVAGLILTRIMCRAMNRSLLAVLAGFTPGVGTKHPLPGEDANDDITGEKQGENEKQDVSEKDDMLTEDSLPALLENAEKIIIVPGYGMAVAQAQMAVRGLVDALERKNKEVKFGIHPVAGRMPGHMNVLLAEAGIDYEKLLDLDAINTQFAHADLVIVIGACDVVNPAANTVEGTPISGMPVLNAEEAKNIIVCNIDEKPGYSGVDNILYQQKHVLKIWGDAAETIPNLTALLNK
jgi:H+-translocating NAD(P) transhydrogenase subunit beta